MSKLFLSHSSHNNAEALAINSLLVAHGWDDVFLDLDPERGIVAGERWEKALHDAANRCDAVIFLVSQAWIDSSWCRKEFRLAHHLNKRIIGLLIEDIEIEALPDELTASWQLVNLSSGSDHQLFETTHPTTGEQQHVHFSVSGLTCLKTGLVKAGLAPQFFEWPPQHDHERAPYRGMRPLEADDAGIFFGREAPTIDLLARLRGLRDSQPPRLMVILGASGAGKSSFLRAGILPRLSRDDRHYLPLPIIRPEEAVIESDNGLLNSLLQAFKAAGLKMNRGALRKLIADDVDELIVQLQALISASIVTALPGERDEAPVLVLPIDQGEELFLSAGADESSHFLTLLQKLVTHQNLPMMVIFTIRSDSYDYLQTTKALEGLPQHTFSLMPMPTGAYRDVIEGPAKRLKDSHRPLIIEPALTERLMLDIEKGGSKDALPLLAFTLERLYIEYGDDGDLTLDEYESMRGIEGALEVAVEQAFKEAINDPRLPNDKQALGALIRRGLIPWLAGIDPVTQSPKRRVAKLSEIPAEAKPMIEHLIKQRLLATDTDINQETTIEPAHEALLRQWGLLQGWLKEDFSVLSTIESLQSASRDWEANSRDTQWLSHSAGRLEDAEAIKQREDLINILSTSDWDYLKACRAFENDIKHKELEDAKRLAEAKTKEAQAQKSVVKRTRIGLVISMFLIVVASYAGWEAVKKSEQAERSKFAAEHQQQKAIAEKNQALIMQSRSLVQSAKLLIHEDYWGSVLLLLNALPGKHGGDRPLVEEAKLLLTHLMSFKGNKKFDSRINSFNFNPDGSKIAVVTHGYNELTGKYPSNISIFSMHDDMKILHSFVQEGAYVRVSFNNDGTYLLASSQDGEFTLWSMETYKEVRISEYQYGTAEFSLQKDQILVTNGSMDSKLYSITTGEELAEFPNFVEASHAIFSSNGQYMLITETKDTAIIWSLETNEAIQILENNHDSWPFATFSPNNKLVLMKAGNSAKIWKVETGELLHELQHDDSVYSALFTPDSKFLITRSFERFATLWSIETGEALRKFKHQEVVESIDISNDGKKLLTSSRDKTSKIWDIQTGDIIQTFYEGGSIDSAEFSPNNKLVVNSVSNWLYYWETDFHIKNIVMYTEKKLPESKACLSAEQRQKFFLPILTPQLLAFRGCSSLESKNKPIITNRKQIPNWPKDHYATIKQQADTNDTDAMITLGNLAYRNENFIQAKRWFEQALSAGNDNAAQRLLALQKTISLKKKNLANKWANKYDDSGNIIEATFFGLHGKPILSKKGFAKWTAKYNDRGKKIEEAYFGLDDQPILDNLGIAKWTSIYDDRGDSIETAYFGLDGKPILSKEGFAKWTAKYNDRGKRIETAYFGLDGKPILSKEGFAKWTAKYNDRGKKIEEAYFGLDDQPISGTTGFSKSVNHYNVLGYLIKREWFDLHGEPVAPNSAGYASRTMTYNSNGKEVVRVHLDAQGFITMSDFPKDDPHPNFAQSIRIYDSSGYDETYRFYLDTEKQLIVTEGDSISRKKAKEILTDYFATNPELTNTHKIKK
jgi:WD40 repeat protein